MRADAKQLRSKQWWNQWNSPPFDQRIPTDCFSCHQTDQRIPSRCPELPGLPKAMPKSKCNGRTLLLAFALLARAWSRHQVLPFFIFWLNSKNAIAWTQRNLLFLLLCSWTLTYAFLVWFFGCTHWSGFLFNFDSWTPCHCIENQNVNSQISYRLSGFQKKSVAEPKVSSTQEALFPLDGRNFTWAMRAYPRCNGGVEITWKDRFMKLSTWAKCKSSAIRVARRRTTCSWIVLERDCVTAA